MIDFEHVSKEYKKGGRLALEDINFHVDEGEFVFLLGHSGAGKSTLLKLILRETLPTSGKVTVLGKDVAKLRRHKIPYLRRQMGIIFQDFRLIPSMTVDENEAFAMHVLNVPRKEIRPRVEYILELVHLEDKAKCYPYSLSGGEQQRVAVARALVHNPKLVIADEPTGNIDPVLSLEMMQLLERVSKMGITVLVVTVSSSVWSHCVMASSSRTWTQPPWPPPRMIFRGMLPPLMRTMRPLQRRRWLPYDASLYLLFPYPARCAQLGQALGHDHCLHRFFECLYDPEYLCQSGRGECGQHGGLSGQPERDGGLSGPRM